MSTARCRISDYLGLVADETEETKFLSSIPWTLDALPQTTEPMIKTLRYEAVRFAELSHQPLFALLTVIRDTPPRHIREFILSALPILSELGADPGGRRQCFERASVNRPKVGQPRSKDHPDDP